MNRQIQHLTEAVRIDMGVALFVMRFRVLAFSNPKTNYKTRKDSIGTLTKSSKRKPRRSSSVTQTVTQVDDFSLYRRSFSIE